MQKLYIVRLTEEEREICRDVIGRLKGSSERVRRAQVLLQADADGPGWDREIAAAFSCRVKTVENIRQRCVLEGFDKALERKQRATPPTPKILDGESEARIIACVSGHRRRVTPIGVCGCWHITWSSWGLSSRSAAKRSDGR